ncbi:hypothetical protein DC28_10865 [Spirochaeta lutea]|uniref:SHSP domain-containing protein n=1 Tax=Spirochaeta lutea TaxID=1480694 RepID=A0A098QV54_9SPIO|nr:hypothetical protein DC28_10865 [Spirochaeta lutea]
MFNEMDRILDSMFDNSHSFGRVGSLTTRHPSVDIRENEAGYILEAELPGLTQEDIDITLEDGVLHLSQSSKGSGDSNAGETEQQEQTKPAERYLLRERNRAEINRSFVLPKDVDQAKVQARFAHGLLILELPKQEKALPKKISISAE